MQRRLQFNTTKPRLATSRATAVPYICLMVCCTAIRLLRDDPVASLVGSLASSTSCFISRNPLCFPRRSIVFESSSSTSCILHCTQNVGDKFAPKLDTNGRLARELAVQLFIDTATSGQDQSLDGIPMDLRLSPSLAWGPVPNLVGWGKTRGKTPSRICPWRIPPARTTPVILTIGAVTFFSSFRSSDLSQSI
jgi:hypothetical protein